MRTFLIPALLACGIFSCTAAVNAQDAKPAEGSMFDGDISDFTSSLPSYLPIKVRRDSSVIVNGKPEKRTFYEQQNVDPHAEKLTPEQRLGIFVAVVENQIQENLQTLAETDDEDAKKKILDDLKQQFKDRYTFDTAYHDFKASQAEEEAAALRAEVDERKGSEGSWVDAMMTVVKTRTEGIETMDFNVLTRPPAPKAVPVEASSPSDVPSSLTEGVEQ